MAPALPPSARATAASRAPAILAAAEVLIPAAHPPLILRRAREPPVSQPQVKEGLHTPHPPSSCPPEQNPASRTSAGARPHVSEPRATRGPLRGPNDAPLTRRAHVTDPRTTRRTSTSTRSTASNRPLLRVRARRVPARRHWRALATSSAIPGLREGRGRGNRSYDVSGFRAEGRPDGLVKSTTTRSSTGRLPPPAPVGRSSWTPCGPAWACRVQPRRSPRLMKRRTKNRPKTPLC